MKREVRRGEAFADCRLGDVEIRQQMLRPYFSSLITFRFPLATLPASCVGLRFLPKHAFFAVEEPVTGAVVLTYDPHDAKLWPS